MLFPARRYCKVSLGRDYFFVKIVETLGCFGDLMYICNSLDSI